MSKLILKHKVKGEDIPVTTSRKVAEHFEKRHDHVIRDIENILDGGGPNFGLSSMFILSSYKSAQNKELKEYLLTQDGFTLLAMRFTGPKALKFQVSFIKAFNDMNKELEEFRLQRKLSKEGYRLFKLYTRNHTLLANFMFSKSIILVTVLYLKAFI